MAHFTEEGTESKKLSQAYSPEGAWQMQNSRAEFAQSKAQPLSHCAILLSYGSTDMSSNLPSSNGRPSASGFN